MNVDVPPEQLAAQYRTQLNTAFDKLLELSSSPAKAKGWSYHSQKHNVLATTRQTKGLLSSRGQGLIPSPPALVFSMVFDIKRLPQWDAMVQQATLVKEFDNDMLLLRIELKGSFPLSARDICVIFGYRLHEDGTYVVAIRSVFSPLVPEVRGYVRAHLDPSGFVIRPSVDILQIDPRGWIPFSVAKMLQNYEPLRIAKIRALCDSRIESDWGTPKRDKVESELCRTEAEAFVVAEKKRLETEALPSPPPASAAVALSVGDSNKDNSLASPQAGSKAEIPSPVKKTKLHQDLLSLSLSPSVAHRLHHGGRPMLKLPTLEKGNDSGSEEENLDSNEPNNRPDINSSVEDRHDRASSEDSEYPHSNSEARLITASTLSSSTSDPLNVEDLVQEGSYEKALSILKAELDKLEKESESTSQHIQDFEWTLVHEQNRQSQYATKSPHNIFDRVRFKALLNDYMEQIKRLAERTDRVEKQIKQRETQWESRLIEVADKLAKAEHTYDVNKQELRNKKYWKTVWNSIIIVIVFVMWPLIASGLWNFFTPKIERLLYDVISRIRWNFARVLLLRDDILSRLNFLRK